MFYIIKRNKIRLSISFILFLLSIVILCYLMLSSDIKIGTFLILIFLFCCFFSKSLFIINRVFSKIQGNEKNYRLVPFLNISNTELSKDFDKSVWKSWHKGKTGFYFYSGDITTIKNLPVVIKPSIKLKSDFLYRLTLLSEYYFLFIKKDYLDNKSFRDFLKQREENKTYALLSDFKDSLVLTSVDIRDALLDQKILGRELLLDSICLSSSRLLFSENNGKYILKSMENDHFINGIQLNVLFVTDGDTVVVFDSIPNCFYSFTKIDICETVDKFCKAEVRRYLNTDDIEVDLCGVYLSCEDVSALVLVCTVFLSTQFFSSYRGEMQFLSFNDFLALKDVNEKTLMLQHALRVSNKKQN